MSRRAFAWVPVLVLLAVGCDCCDPTETLCKQPPDPSGATDQTAPSVPTGVAASAAGTDRIHVAWSPASDDHGVAGYRVYRGGTSFHDTAATAFDDAGLSPGTLHCYAVTAFDAAGNESARSQEDCARTLAETCTPGCAGKTCGPDGCGGTCGSCPASSTCNGTECACSPGYVLDPTSTKCIQLGGSCSGTGVDAYGYCADDSTWVWCDPRHGITWMSCPQVLGTRCQRGPSSGTWGACGCGAIDGANGTCGSGGSGWSANELHFYCSDAGILFAQNCKAQTGRSTGLCSTLVTAFGWQTDCFCSACTPYDVSSGTCYSAGSSCSYSSSTNTCSCQ